VVLQHLRKKLPLAQFFKVINDKPVASQLFEGWAKTHDRELLKDFYYQDDRKSASAGILIGESLEQSAIASRIDKLQLSKKIYLESKEYAFEAKVDPDCQLTIDRRRRSPSFKTPRILRQRTSTTNLLHRSLRERNSRQTPHRLRKLQILKIPILVQSNRRNILERQITSSSINTSLGRTTTVVSSQKTTHWI
jgi:Vps16, C-terminal region